MPPPEFPQAAYERLVNQVHAPIFFDKLASEYGIVPRSEDERASLLELAGLIQQTELQESHKSASAAGSPYIQALDELKGVLKQAGSAQVPDSRDRFFKQAAAHLAQDSELAEAAVTWGAYTLTQQ